MLVAFRCDGDARRGAGHVARCRQLARAFRTGGDEVIFVGSYDGIAATLLKDFPSSSPDPARPLGVPRDVDAVVVDSYDIKAAHPDLPIAAVVDGACPVEGAVVLSYHLDAERQLSSGLLGPNYALVDPALVTARRPRSLATGLVTFGGSDAGRARVPEAVRALLALDAGLQVYAASPEGFNDARVHHGVVAGGLAARIEWADVAVSGAGSTPYELACAGVPMALRSIAGNQEGVFREFVAQGLAVEDPAALARTRTREGLASAGVALVDGCGTFRAREGLRAAWSGRPTPRVVRLRPATLGDADRLLGWRNDPQVRAVSRSSAVVTIEDHTRWLTSVLADDSRTLLIAETRGGLPVGTVRFDRTPAGEAAEISIALSPGSRGKSLGTQIIRESTELEFAARPPLQRVFADIQVGNLPSLAAFERVGYRPASGSPDGSVRLLRPRG